MVWKVIEDNYEISNTGLIRNKKTKKIRKQAERKGYMTISLSNSKYRTETKTFRVHRLVAETFLENPNNYEIINHKDGNKSNNDVNNLEWCTPSYNHNHAFRIGLVQTLNFHDEYETKDITEDYKQIDNSPYYINKDGIVINKDNKRVLKRWKSGDDVCVSISINGKQKNIYVKHLIAECYMPEFKKGDVIYHIDGNKDNNTLDNLKIGTIRDCMKVYDKTGRYKKFSQYDRNNNLIKEWEVIAEAAASIEPNNARNTAKGISKCLNNQQSSCKGFIWKYNA